MTDHPHHDHHHTHEDQATPADDRTWVKSQRLSRDRYFVDLASAPFCAYAPAYSSPLPPMEDRLTVRIEAGERNPLGGCAA